MKITTTTEAMRFITKAKLAIRSYIDQALAKRNLILIRPKEDFTTLIHDIMENAEKKNLNWVKVNEYANQIEQDISSAPLARSNYLTFVAENYVNAVRERLKEHICMAGTSVTGSTMPSACRLSSLTASKMYSCKPWMQMAV